MEILIKNNYDIEKSGRCSRKPPRRRKRNVLLQRLHDSHRVTLSALAHPCASEGSTKGFFYAEEESLDHSLSA